MKLPRTILALRRALLGLVFSLAAIGAMAAETVAPELVTTPLGELEPVSAAQGWGELSADRSVQGKPLQIGDRHFAHGLGTHAASEVIYELDRPWQRFEAWVGVDAEMAHYREPSVVFKVIADGRELFDSGVMRIDTPARRVSVPVVGVRELKLVVTDAGDGVNCDHADWAEAALIGPPVAAASAAPSKPAKYRLRTASLRIDLSADGDIVAAALGPKGLSCALQGGTTLAGCTNAGVVTARKLSGGGVEFARRLVHAASGQQATVTERFLPVRDSVRWEVEIRGAGDSWSTPIQTWLSYAGAAARFWAPWSDPRANKTGNTFGASQSNTVVAPAGAGGNWADPLLTRPLLNATFWYGAPYFRTDEPRIGFCPFQGNLLCIPLVTVMEEKDDLGLSLVLSPQDTLLDLTLRVTAGGRLTFSRYFNRISGRAPVRLAADLVAHEADWRGGLRWMTRRYPEYFDPVNRRADALAGTGAYSALEADFNVEKLKRMAFRVNWKASFDFPYMGMFLPPVTNATEAWKRFGGGQTSIAAMRDYAGRMHAQGFDVLSYFNVTEFGAKVAWPPPPRRTQRVGALWQDCNDFLNARLGGAILHVPQRVAPDQLRFYGGTQPGGLYFTWEGAVVLDCGDPDYRAFLLDQARRHIAEIPDAAGICIDRMDWLRMYNDQRDDGVSWFEGAPARSLIRSWDGLMDELGPLMHGTDKVIFVNNHDKRLDVLRHADGIFDEFTYAGAPLNTTALLCVRKPALGWTARAEDLKPDPDGFFQKYLYLGVYPMAPFPGNDHSLRPDPWVDRQYLDYGPLLAAMRGKKWVLEPHCVESATTGVKANLFEVPGGYVVPVTFGGAATNAVVRIRNVPGLKAARCQALHPGAEKWIAVPTTYRKGALELRVPLERGCAMVRITR